MKCMFSKTDIRSDFKGIANNWSIFLYVNVISFYLSFLFCFPLSYRQFSPASESMDQRLADPLKLQISQEFVRLRWIYARAFAFADSRYTKALRKIQMYVDAFVYLDAGTIRSTEFWREKYLKGRNIFGTGNFSWVFDVF